jgi:hypothetical protein
MIQRYHKVSIATGLFQAVFPAGRFFLKPRGAACVKQVTKSGAIDSSTTRSKNPEKREYIQLFMYGIKGLFMKKRTIFLGLFLTAAFLMTGSIVFAQTANTPAPAQGTEKAAPVKKKVVHQTICPVMGGKIDRKLFVDADGKRIYVCCSACLEKVKADPQKYIKEMEDKGITLYKTPKKSEKKKAAGDTQSK